MSSWRDYARPIEDAFGSCAESANSAKSPSSAAPIGTNGTNGTLSGSIGAGLTLLADMAAPRVRCPETWPQVVADASRLVAEGWAAKALELGWSHLDLFGAVVDPEGQADGDGLAARLSGREVLAISANFLTVADGRAGRAFLHRPVGEGARLLWELERDE